MQCKSGRLEKRQFCFANDESIAVYVAAIVGAAAATVVPPPKIFPTEQSDRSERHCYLVELNWTPFVVGIAVAV